MQLVEHKIYGEGIVLSKRFKGFELHVKFDDGISRWIRSDEIVFKSDKSILKEPDISRPKLSEEQLKNRQMIEALRLGIVPYRYVEKFTFGREKEIEQIKTWLNNPNDNAYIITGEYGSGKSHLLEYIYSLALKCNWAVSLVELDINELPFHRPNAIYQKVISSFKFMERNGNFREYLRKIARSQNSYELEHHRYFETILKAIKYNTDDEYFWEWIEGKSSGIYSLYGLPMYNYYTAANIYCYLLSGIGWAAKNILGLNGLLILFDEAESVDPYWYNSYRNDKGWNFLKGLILMANNTIELLKEEIQYDYRGYDTGLQYCGKQFWTRFLWRIPCCVKIVFAFTPFDWILEREPLNKLRELELDHIDTESFKEISEEIIKIYQQAYNFERKINGNTIYRMLPKDKTRRFIKGLVEILDIMRFYPDKEIGKLLKK